MGLKASVRKQRETWDLLPQHCKKAEVCACIPAPGLARNGAGKHQSLFFFMLRKLQLLLAGACLASLRATHPLPLQSVPGFYQPCCRKLFLVPLEKLKVFFTLWHPSELWRRLLPSSLKYVKSWLCFTLIFFYLSNSSHFFVSFSLFPSPQAWSLFKQDLLLPDLHRSGHWRPAYAEAAVGERQLLQLVRLVDSFYIRHPESQSEIGRNSEKVTCGDVISCINFNWQCLLIPDVSQGGTKHGKQLQIGAALITRAPVASNGHICQPCSVVCFHWDLQSVVLLPHNSFVYHCLMCLRLVLICRRGSPWTSISDCICSCSPFSC